MFLVPYPCQCHRSLEGRALPHSLFLLWGSGRVRRWQVCLQVPGGGRGAAGPRLPPPRGPGSCRGWAPAQLQGNFWQGWLILKLLLGETAKKCRSIFCPYSAKLSVLGLRKRSSATPLEFLFSFRPHIFSLLLHEVCLQFNKSFKIPTAVFNGFPRASSLSFIPLLPLLIIFIFSSGIFVSHPLQKPLPP